MVDVVANHMVISQPHRGTGIAMANSNHRATMEQGILLTIVYLIPLTLRHIFIPTV